MVIRWLNNSELVYSVSSIETLNINTREIKRITEGSDPKPSLDGQWIAFIYENQLWIIDINESNSRQLSYIKDGLGDYEFAWAPNSKFIALKNHPDFHYWENTNPPQSKIYIIDIMTGISQEIASFDASINYISWLPKTPRGSR